MSTDYYLVSHTAKKVIHVAQDGLSGWTFYYGEPECMKALSRFLEANTHTPLELVAEQYIYSTYDHYEEIEWNVKEPS